MAGEAINPRKDVPVSVAYTLTITGVSYVLSALALAGMVPVGDSPAAASFALAFDARRWEWASKVLKGGGRGKRGGRESLSPSWHALNDTP